LLVLSNHQSFLDPIFGHALIWQRFHFVARDSLFKNKFFGAVLRSVNAIPIKRDAADLSTVRKIISKLNQGLAVCLYPEGTRTSDGRIADIKPGFGLLSRRSGAKIVPVVIDGAFECWPRHKKFPSIGKVAVSYGEPISPEQVRELGDEELARVLTGQLRGMQSDLRIKSGKEPFDYSQATEAESKKVP
jgi:1-acyl-sn-glycerol-3-phosphate acyltransferase